MQHTAAAVQREMNLIEEMELLRNCSVYLIKIKILCYVLV